MNEEIFDVVNERDEVIGQQPRGVVHRLGLLHRAVHVLVFNAAGQVFLQKRSMTKDRQPGLWDSSASGHVDAREDYDACAVRELHEEIGLQLSEAPRGSSSSPRPPKPIRSMFGSITARRRGRFACTRRRSSAVAGLHPQKSRVGWRSGPRILPARCC
jgi:8-oxo-dGTP pyrophosphatase MutT (NUDIX family)